MEIFFVFKSHSKKHYLRLPLIVQKRILSKLNELKNHEDVFSVLRRLTDMEPATHRLRVGSYRLILELVEQSERKMVFWVLDVGDRKGIYR